MDLTTEKVRDALTAAEAEARQLYADAVKVKEGMIDEGIDPLAKDPKSQEAFGKVDDAFKAYSLKVNEIEGLRARLGRLTEIDGLSGPIDRTGVAQRLGLGGSRPRHLEDAGDGRRPVSIGRRFVASEAYQDLHARQVFRSEASFAGAMAAGIPAVDVMSRDELEALLGTLNSFYATVVTGGGATSGGPFIQPDLVPGFVAYRRKRPLLSAMVGPGTTDSDVVEYVAQTAPTDAGAETAEDTAAPESTLPWATETVNVREITHFVPVTLRAMADHGQIRTIVENELVLGALDRLDTEIASGDGTGVNLTGIYTTGAIGTQALGGDSRPDAIHKAITAIRIAAGVLGEPDYIGIHPSDAEQLILETDAQGNYLFGPPSAPGARAAWGVPLAISTVFTSGTPLVGDFGGCATLWLREALSVTTGLNATDFVQRRVSILAALRIAFAVTRPGGFCTVTGF